MEVDELRRIWREVTTWRDVFRQFDKDASDYIDSSELQSIFKSIGTELPTYKIMVGLWEVR